MGPSQSRISTAALEKYWGMSWRFFTVCAIVYWIVRRIEIPVLVCRTPVMGEVSVEIVDISEQIESIDCHSSKARFLGPRNEAIPKDLRLPEWEEMEYVEPDFVIP